MRARLFIGIAALCAAIFSAGAAAQAYPTKPVKLVVGFAAGGPTDVLARLLGEKLGASWGQPVIVDNRPGAGGTIAAGIVAQAAPDGYTLNLAPSAHVYNGVLRKLQFDPIKDFTPIAGVSYYPELLVVHPSVPAGNVRELVAYAKAHPGKLAFGSAGTGSGSHLTAELFKRAAGVDILIVHYKGASPATTDLVAGRLQGMFNNPVSALLHVRTGALRVLATTAPKRSPLLDYPTVAEAGYPGFETGVWFALIGPAGLPGYVTEKVARDAKTIVSTPEMQKKFADLGLETRYSTPAELAAKMRSDFQKYSDLIQAAGIKAD